MRSDGGMLSYDALTALRSLWMFVLCRFERLESNESIHILRALTSKRWSFFRDCAAHTEGILHALLPSRNARSGQDSQWNQPAVRTSQAFLYSQRVEVGPGRRAVRW